ncbi:molybdopterin-guanine dinucleotide biosynthesis protein A [Singulisphaera sp. GP187]|uniref:molybdenum cofactor guanylyltransferase n=1 Tax=Singulisphaera sp. GP187 TaxID=1882752 RepID=UPI0009281016|nr:molybdenum cofactor guanylyltransferase [Singulisphaera sp. GP187]SIN86807.1 molybdopterin-guanine dinucleotide biosynthesis protein A [Singulisphaera sp. GP187]
MRGAVVLCGGESRRMGQPKAGLAFGPERLLQRVVRIVSEQANVIVVVAAPGQVCPPLPDSVRIVHDPVSGRGPLQGLAAGLTALPCSVEFVFATATDTPFLRPAWIKRLHELIGVNDLALPFVDGFHHPLSAVYRRATSLPAMEKLLRQNQFRLLNLMDLLQTHVVESEELRHVDPELASLRNLNTPEEYAKALSDAGLPVP